MENNMNNERKNNTYGVFYGVIGVATLIITIIGATFAYFTATAGSGANEIQTGGANISLGFDGDDTGKKVNLIPIDESLGQFQNVVGDGENECKDINGNNICSVYTFNIGNPAGNTANMEVTAKITPQKNTFTNLWIAIFKGTPTEIKGVTNKFKVNGVAVPASKPSSDCDLKVCDWGDIADGTLIYAARQLTKDNLTAFDVPLMQQVFKPGEYEDYTIVLWIHETGTDQDEDQGGEFAGGINFTTSAGENKGITGVLGA
ncbi:MAG: hypothetical protein IJO57_01415 [Bacilli bacterium]|nr:hypothetical protein [Bacilli bacterium]